MRLACANRLAASTTGAPLVAHFSDGGADHHVQPTHFNVGIGGKLKKGGVRIGSLTLVFRIPASGALLQSHENDLLMLSLT